MHHMLKNLTCDHLTEKKDYPILIVSICLGKSIRIKRVNISKQQVITSLEKVLITLGIVNLR